MASARFIRGLATNTRADGQYPSMTARIIDGKAIASDLRGKVADAVVRLAREHALVPGLAVVLVGNNPASESYVGSKVKMTAGSGMRSLDHRLAESTSEAELLALVARLNADPAVHGILVQLPLPPQIDAQKVIAAIDPAKDVDGFHPVNIGNLVTGRPGSVPCTPAGIVEILVRSEIPIAGARAVVVGRSDIVGKPVAMLLLHHNATVTICHSRTRDLAGVAREADILVVAMGKAALVTGSFIKRGATVIDVGVNRVTSAEEVQRIFHDSGPQLEQLKAKGSVLVGDVQPEDAVEKAGAYTPVPGGVGPLTIAMLMSNTVRAAHMRRGLLVGRE
jgi:methylenetetrahydrofolate dehydrogenase (NADP+)/methenyltetrahydrofolate cyclohydrolase